MIVKPKPGIKLWNPDRKRFVRDAGENVTDGQYWQRRIADGSAIVVSEIKKPTPQFGSSLGNHSPQTEDRETSHSKKKKGSNKKDSEK